MSYGNASLEANIRARVARWQEQIATSTGPCADEDIVQDSLAWFALERVATQGNLPLIRVSAPTPSAVPYGPIAQQVRLADMATTPLPPRALLWFDATATPEALPPAWAKAMADSLVVVAPPSWKAVLEEAGVEFRSDAPPRTSRVHRPR